MYSCKNMFLLICVYQRPMCRRPLACSPSALYTCPAASVRMSGECNQTNTIQVLHKYVHV